MTTLDVFCGAMGWQGGTIHQAKERFAIASESEMNRVCSRISANIREISDLDNAQWFMAHRREAIGLVVRAAS